ncbi:hypothetical protein C8F04DRAFT_1186371 [Mycena alexandri]|uniref:Uncharacterized protein n=1 Tax=Mycena alexandri TaxID=1745969 RepID=A0AAD6SNM3_9AGAR|nr:hypothetical protein C8F04DRAFT_1186371 [Mycena alexandri]
MNRSTRKFKLQEDSYHWLFLPRGTWQLREHCNAEQEPDLGEEPPDEVREEDQEDNDEEEGEKEVTEMVYQLMRLAVNGHIEQTFHEYVEVDPGHKDSGKRYCRGRDDGKRAAGQACDGA